MLCIEAALRTLALSLERWQRGLKDIRRQRLCYQSKRHNTIYYIMNEMLQQHTAGVLHRRHQLHLASLTLRNDNAKWPLAG